MKKNFIVSAIVLHFAITYLSCHAAASVLDGNGNGDVSVDEEVMRILEHNNYEGDSTVNFNEPHVEERLSRRHVFPDATQQQNLPYSAIGFLQINDGSKNGRACSAFLVGPNHLITAAHCVHTPGNTKSILPSANLTFYLGRNCNSAGVEYNIAKIITHHVYRESGWVEYEIAYLLLSSNAESWIAYGFQEFFIPAFNSPMSPVTAEICGYSRNIRPGNSYHCVQCSTCTSVGKYYPFDAAKNSRNTVFQITCDKYGGVSGGPLIGNNQGHYNVLGVKLGQTFLKPGGVTVQSLSAPFTEKFHKVIDIWKCITCATDCPLKMDNLI